MKLHTARQIVCDVTMEKAEKVARSSGRTVESVLKEAKTTIRKANKVERMNRKNG